MVIWSQCCILVWFERAHKQKALSYICGTYFPQTHLFHLKLRPPSCHELIYCVWLVGRKSASVSVFVSGKRQDSLLPCGRGHVLFTLGAETMWEAVYSRGPVSRKQRILGVGFRSTFCWVTENRSPHWFHHFLVLWTYRSWLTSWD